MEKTERKKPSLFARILRFAGEKRGGYAASVILAILGVICQIIPYYLIGAVVQKLLGGERVFSAFAPELALTALFWTLRILLHSLSTTCSHRATFAVLANIRRAICAKLTRAPLGDVKNIPTGSLKSTIVERVDSMETTLAHVVPEFTANILAPVVIFILLCTISGKLALASLVTLPVGLIAMGIMMRGTAKQWANCIEKTKILNDTAVEYINGIEVIKAFGKADSSYEKFRKAAKDGADCFIEWMRQSIVPFTFAMSVTPATVLTVLPIGALLFLRGELTGSELVMGIILASSLMMPLLTVMSFQDDLAKASQIFDETSALLDMREMIRPAVTEQEPEGGDIALENVHFGYGPEKEILHGINMRIRAGSVNALVGPSGSGKSTIARLIASLWDVDEGRITLGGADIRRIAADDYNRRIAYVSQDNYLFNTTIRENIRMGRRGASDAEVEQAARQCGCHEFIMELEQGYDTVCGDAGAHLSGGERQRISIARAMLKDADVIILDEATAYTDPENEAVIQRSLARIIRGKTLIVIAHRLSTVADADRIFVVSNGRIDAEGTHEELLEQNGLYRRMWEAHVAARDSVCDSEEGGAA